MSAPRRNRKEKDEVPAQVRELRYLIADSGGSRKSIRKLLSELGVKPGSIEMVDNFAEAKALLSARRSQVIFAEDTLGEHSGLELLSLQQELISAHETRIFFLITGRNSSAAVSSSAEDDVDALLIKPFTVGALREQVIEVLTSLLEPTPYEQLVRLGKAHFKKGDIASALETFQAAREADPLPALACAYIGLCHEMNGRTEEARQSFEQGLTFNPRNFKCLMGLLEILLKEGKATQAYAIGRNLMSSHTIPVQKIPVLIRISIANQKFEDVLGFFHYADALKQADPRSSLTLAAGLVVCGLYLLRHDKQQEAVDSFRKAESVSGGNPKITLRIVTAMITAGLNKEAKPLLARLPDEMKNGREIRIAELQVFEREASAAAVLDLALQMLHDGFQEEEVFSVAIRKSFETGRKQAHIAELISQATAKYPDKGAYFAGLIAGIGTPPASGSGGNDGSTESSASH